MNKIIAEKEFDFFGVPVIVACMEFDRFPSKKLVRRLIVRHLGKTTVTKISPLDKIREVKQ